MKYSAAEVSPEQLRAAVNKIGFEAGSPVGDRPAHSTAYMIPYGFATLFLGVLAYRSKI